ncbi:EF hand [Lutibacter oricola]|uniref:EF hand n=1 Tax=Lutibacter oricola TaxID=762486 RepID=A0A1H2XHZ9_9FLAO|nr:hypothetical protein [Lutibacter oricola]SDW92436.1 EF hand [Lutibacter oricola]
MKFLKGTILVVALLAINTVIAQDSKEKAEKKLGWMDADKNGSVSLEEMTAFYEGKKDKKGRPIKAKDIFIGSDHNNDKKITVDEFQKKINWKKVNKSKTKIKKPAKKGLKVKNKLPEGKDEKRLFWMDKDKNGSVSKAEMIEFFKGKKDKNGKPKNGEEFFIGSDANDDGKVTLDELKKGVNWKKVNANKKK